MKFCFLHDNRRKETKSGYYLHCVKCGRDKLVAPKIDVFLDSHGRSLQKFNKPPALWLEYPLDGTEPDVLVW